MDSGQGSIEIEPETMFSPTPLSATKTISEQYIFYNFELPHWLVGRLIGKKGCFVNKIKAVTDATVIIRDHQNGKVRVMIAGSRAFY